VLTPGKTFGTGGDGFARLNVGCHEDLLRAAVARLVAALS
jgi:bifunctional pyridoxal-dependent enzyme with beta-cystathionase and maltose regulon repressor activities